jgi:hypothetical protein
VHPGLLVLGIVVAIGAWVADPIMGVIVLVAVLITHVAVGLWRANN